MIGPETYHDECQYYEREDLEDSGCTGRCEFCSGPMFDFTCEECEESETET